MPILNAHVNADHSKPRGFIDTEKSSDTIGDIVARDTRGYTVATEILSSVTTGESISTSISSSTTISYHYSRNHVSISTFLHQMVSQFFDTTIVDAIGSLPSNISYIIKIGETAVLLNYICFLFINQRIFRLEPVNRGFIQIFMNKNSVTISFMAINLSSSGITYSDFILYTICTSTITLLMIYLALNVIIHR